MLTFKRNSLIPTVLMMLLLFMSLITSTQTAVAGDGSGGGQNPPLLRGACLTAINNNVSSTGESLGENMALTDNPPTIRLEFATNIADNTVWNNNQNYVKLYDSNSDIIPANVSRIDPTVTFAERNYIFIKPLAVLDAGSYKIAVDAKLTSKNGVSAGQEQSVSFSVPGNSDSNDNTSNNDTGSNTNTDNNNNSGNNDSSIVLTDITGHWAEANINRLVKSGVISGYPDGTFKPDNSISRAEFVSIIVNALKLEPKTGKVFEDTADHWAKDAISTAAGYGIVNGYDSANFGPDDKITREQMAVVIDNALKLNNIAGGKTFADQNEISTWAKDAVARSNQNGIFTGYPDNTFRPQANASRAETAIVILNALYKIKLIF
jgi:hypothetical protein